MKESRIHEVTKNKELIFHMGEVSVQMCKTIMVNMFFFVDLTSRPVFRSQKLSRN